MAKDINEQQATLNALREGYFLANLPFWKIGAGVVSFPSEQNRKKEK